jgi:hypothetical protein
VTQGWGSVTDHYETLGVSRSASDDIIRAAYRARMRQAHPDAGGDPDDAKKINDAYETLSDPARRAAYERDHRPAPAAVPHPPAAQHAQAQTREQRKPRQPASVVRWWRRRATVVAASTWVLISTAVTWFAGHVSGDWPFAAAAAAVSVLALGALTLSRWKSAVVLCALLIVLAFAVPTLAYTAPALLVASVGAGLIFRRARSDELDELVSERASTFWDTLEHTQDVDAWFAENVAPEGPRTTVLLQHLDSDARATRVLWGDIVQGTYLLLADAAEEPLMSVPFAVMDRADKVANRRARRARRT